MNDAKLLNVVNSFEKIQKSQRQTLAILNEKDLSWMNERLQARPIQKMILSRIGYQGW